VHVCGDHEAAESPDGHGPAQLARRSGCFPLREVLDVLSGVGALVVADLVDGHGEVLAAGVLPPGDRGVHGFGEHREPIDLGPEVADRVAERVLVAQVGAFGALEPSQGSVGFGLVQEQRVAGGDGLDLAE
jgi:hypothetical protein